MLRIYFFLISTPTEWTKSPQGLWWIFRAIHIDCSKYQNSEGKINYVFEVCVQELKMKMRIFFLKAKIFNWNSYVLFSCDSFKNMKEAKQSSWQISGKYNT